MELFEQEKLFEVARAEVAMKSLGNLSVVNLSGLGTDELLLVGVEHRPLLLFPN